MFEGTLILLGLIFLIILVWLGDGLLSSMRQRLAARRRPTAQPGSGIDEVEV